MDKQAILTINGISYTVMHFRYGFYRPTDAKGRPRHGLKGGDTHVTMETEVAKELLETIADYKDTPVTGSLEVWESDLSSRPRILEWDKAFIYSVSEFMMAGSPMPMLTTISISPIRLDINRFISIDRRWPETSGLHWEEYTPKEQKTSTVGEPQETPVEEVIKPQITEIHYESLDGTVWNKWIDHGEFILSIKSENAIGKSLSSILDFPNRTIKYKEKELENNKLENIVINSDEMKIKLRSEIKIKNNKL